MDFRIPSDKTLSHACKISIVEDKPIMMDYWSESLEQKVILGVRMDGEQNEKLLVKNEEEYTSPISKIYSVEQDYIIMTENSLYIVSNKIPKKRIR